MGDVLAVHHDRPGGGTILAFFITWIVMSGLTFIAPGETPLLAVAPSAGFFLIGVLIYTMLSGERLIVCERGILVGSVAPFLRPYVIRYEQIVPGSIVPISANIRRFGKQTGLPIMTTIRIAWWSRRGIAFAGPTPAAARGRTGRKLDDQISQGTPWLIGTHTSAVSAADDIARAAQAAGYIDLAQKTFAVVPRVLTGDPRDTPAHFPAFTLPGSRQT